MKIGIRVIKRRMTILWIHLVLGIIN